MNSNSIINIPVNKLRAFEGHPYKVLDNDEMDELTESIRERGVLAPLIVRPLENAAGEYEVISGHRRLHAAQRAGLDVIPTFVHEIGRDAAAIELVDSNLHREHILPSEKAFAYKLRFDALKHQGRRTGQVGPKLTVDAISDDDSGRQVKRYIRLTNLIPALLDLVDEGRIAFSVGVELSYLPVLSQEYLAELIEQDEATPSYSQAVRMHKENGLGFSAISEERIDEIMAEDKPNQRERVSLPLEQLRRFFPESYTPREMQNAIMKLIQDSYEPLPQKKPRDRGTR